MAGLGSWRVGHEAGERPMTGHEAGERVKSGPEAGVGEQAKRLGAATVGREGVIKLVEELLSHKRAKGAPSRKRGFEETGLNTWQSTSETLGRDFKVMGQEMHTRRGKETKVRGNK